MNVILSLLYRFIKIGLFSIGGGYATIPLIQEQVVDIQKWLSIQEFTDIITISQMTPGPLAINTSTFVGLQVAGLPGAIVATFGCIISGFFISIFLYRFFQKHKNAEAIFNVLQGLKAASTGLIASSAATILFIAFYGTASPVNLNEALQGMAVVLFLIALAILRRFKVSPMLVILMTGVVGYFVY